ncbi:MAG: hypothetical protein KKG96_03885 [Proteobacteria bacterium]|nr:hypothetical protein [Pseudomonadota bacterium]MBU1966372.1 hypothetical protein [Pseudomonadota bacterium]
MELKTNGARSRFPGSNLDGFARNLSKGHTGEDRYPEPLRNTGFRVKPGMTKEAINGLVIRPDDVFFLERGRE